jgi:PAS domain S-box-containing protein
VTGGLTNELALLIESVSDYAIFVLDPKGHIASWNRGANRLKGYTAEEIIGQHFSTFYTDADRDRKHPQHELEVAAREGRFEEEGWRVRKDGTQFWANVVITAIRDENGELLGFGKVTRDLTERKQAHDQLVEAQVRLLRSNEDLQHLAAAAVHDLRDPLQTIAGFAELLQSRYGESLDEDAGRFIAAIVSSAAHMRNLVNELGDYASAAEGEVPIEPTSARSAAERAVQSLQGLIDGNGADVQLKVSDEAEVRGEQLAIERVFQNLISNAVKFGGEGTAHVQVSAERVGDVWRFEVLDDGPGVPESEREAIFQPFRRAKGQLKSGSGLGLAICRKTVERYKGEIDIEDGPSGTGSRFWFTLPAASA